MWILIFQPKSKGFSASLLIPFTPVGRDFIALVFRIGDTQLYAFPSPWNAWDQCLSFHPKLVLNMLAFMSYVLFWYSSILVSLASPLLPVLNFPLCFCCIRLFIFHSTAMNSNIFLCNLSSISILLKEGVEGLSHQLNSPFWMEVSFIVCNLFRASVSSVISE